MGPSPAYTRIPFAVRKGIHVDEYSKCSTIQYLRISSDHASVIYGWALDNICYCYISWLSGIPSQLYTYSLLSRVKPEGQTMVFLRLVMNLGGSYGSKDNSVPRSRFRRHAQSLLPPEGPKVAV